MIVKEFLETFIKNNNKNMIETGINHVLIFEKSIRKEPVCVCRYNYKNEIEVLYKVNCPDITNQILNSNILRIGHGSEFGLDLIIETSVI